MHATKEQFLKRLSNDVVRELLFIGADAQYKLTYEIDEWHVVAPSTDDAFGTLEFTLSGMAPDFSTQMDYYFTIPHEFTFVFTAENVNSYVFSRACISALNNVDGVYTLALSYGQAELS